MSEKKIIIAIDGYSSSGKSTLAKSLAKKIGYTYIDTGAMYRTVTLYAMRNNIIDSAGNIDRNKLIASLPYINISFHDTAQGPNHAFLDNEDVESEIRSMEVSAHVSPVSAIPEVRADLVAKQREMGKCGGMVMDGRDIGTTVFPAAQLKIFLNASPRLRADRRWLELRQKGVDVELEDVYNNICERDLADTTRADSPLRKADDAIELDNGSMTIEQQDEYMLNLFHKTIESL